MTRLRVVLVEDGTFARGSLRGALEALDVDVVAEGSEWEPLADQAEARSADAFVVVSGEYNHSISPALSNLLDHFLEEYFWRPSAIVCYSAGAVT